MTAPAKFVHDEDGRRGCAMSSVVAGGYDHFRRHAAPLAGVHRRARAFLSPTSAYAVILPEVEIGQRRALRNVIIERGVRIPDGARGR